MDHIFIAVIQFEVNIIFYCCQLEHLQRTLEPLAQRVVISSSRVVEESYDQLSFIDSKKISTFAILTMSNYFPYDEPQDLPICSSGHRAVEDNADLAVSVSDCKSAAMEGPATNERSEMQLYFDQTIVQTTVRIPLGEHYRGEYVTCMVRKYATTIIEDLFINQTICRWLFVSGSRRGTKC